MKEQRVSRDVKICVLGIYTTLGGRGSHAREQDIYVRANKRSDRLIQSRLRQWREADRFPID